MAKMLPDPRTKQVEKELLGSEGAQKTHLIKYIKGYLIMVFDRFLVFVFLFWRFVLFFLLVFLRNIFFCVVFVLLFLYICVFGATAEKSQRVPRQIAALILKSLSRFSRILRLFVCCFCFESFFVDFFVGF